MTTRRRIVEMAQLAALLAASVASMATSRDYHPCEPGGYPLHGQSAVPLDAELTLVAHDLPDRGPRIGGRAITLERLDADGQATPVSITADRQRTWPGKGDNQEVEWRLVPDGPLMPDSLYRITGLDASALESAHFDASGVGEPTNIDWVVLQRHFHTGVGPLLLAGFYAPSGRNYTLRLVFSEPVAVDSVEGRVRLSDGIDPGRVTGAQPAGGMARVVRLTYRPAADTVYGGGAVTLLPGVTGADGAPLRGYWPEAGDRILPPSDDAGVPVRMDDPRSWDRFGRLATYTEGTTWCSLDDF